MVTSNIEPSGFTGTTGSSVTTNARRPLRLWPGLVLAALIILSRFVVPAVAPNVMIGGMPLALAGTFAGILASPLIAVWWLVFSRARWLDRVGALALMVIAVLLTYRVVHESIAGGSMGFLLAVLAIPILAVALVVWAFVTRNSSNTTRRVALLGFVVAVCGGFTLIRTGGFTGNFDNDFHWRWSKTPEERLLSQRDEPSGPVAVQPSKVGSEWPGFRGADRDGVVNGVRIETDWTKSPPVEMWRRPVGPGWSSFAVNGSLVYTQEQRGNEEIVSCYELQTGKPVWRHRDKARFYESNGGPGPRGTPTYNNGRVYTLGATGIVNALDASAGNVIWSRNAAIDTQTKVPGWGFSASPLVVDDNVVVATAGNLIAYNISNGEPRWTRLDGGSGYSSPHLATINNVTQILLLNVNGAISVSPADGKQLWEFPLTKSARIIQPALTSEGDVVVHDGEGSTMRRVAVTQGANGWTVQERWTNDGLNPYFNDFVVQEGYVYGFASNGVGCADLKDGERKWTGGNYGHGQLLLLRDQNLLLILAELGDIALVRATPEGFQELGRLPAIKGKTWNHPALAGDVLLIRNGEEMAAFRLPIVRG